MENDKELPSGKLISVDDVIEDEDDEEEQEQEEDQGVTIQSAEETLETTWEVLETARVIYSKYPEYKSQLSDVYLILGDLDLESDNMEAAVSDYSQCLKIREEILNTDDRKLAEIHYSLALALDYTNNLREALIHFICAKKIFETILQKTSINKYYSRY